jgi:peptidyl-prolyl cis-trans isomerase C
MARPAIRLNGVALPPQMIAAEAQHHPAKTPAAAFQNAARALIVRTLLLEEARRRRLEAVPDMVAPGKRETQDEALIRALLDDAVPIAEPSEVACRSHYENHPDRFRSPGLQTVSHILLAAGAEDAAELERAEADARNILAELARQPTRFEAIARERSDCPSRSAGGHLGQLAPGDLVGEIESVLSRLAPGETWPEPVKTRFGIHIIRLNARVEGKLLPFDYVRERVAALLAEREWRRDSAAFIASLVDKASIEGIEMGRSSKVHAP